MSTNNPYDPQGSDSTNNPYGQPSEPQQPNPAQQPAPGYYDYNNAGGQQYPQQGPYQGQPHPGQPYQGQPYGAVNPQGQKDAQTSWILGLIGLITSLGIILGPMALHYAKKAERAGVSATAGKVLGWISIVFFVFSILAVIAFFYFINAGVLVIDDVVYSTY
ncbi:hypothetical protein [Timonella sp. A28]|uniref:hypothetical protein n=1 Tax=Timonella sp. A28 TaxID=3442640 RepID=UPI003EB8E9AD